MLIKVKYSYNFILQKKNIDFSLSQLTSDGCTREQFSVQCTPRTLPVHSQGMESLKSFETADVVSLGERIEDKIEKSKEM